jgi:hypothetical protein
MIVSGALRSNSNNNRGRSGGRIRDIHSRLEKVSKDPDRVLSSCCAMRTWQGGPLIPCVATEVVEFPVSGHGWR